MLSKLKQTINLTNYAISKRVTVWYTIFFLLLMLGVIAGVVFLVNYQMRATTTVALRTTVSHAVTEYQKDQNDFSFFRQNVYLSRFNNAGELQEGNVPIALQGKFMHEQVGEVEVAGELYMYYDLFEPKTKQWFRGVISMQQNEGVLVSLMQTIVIVAPLAILFVLIGGYYIIRHAMSPLRKMLETTERIQEDVDLSKRIELKDGGQDEVYRLAKSFNNMLDTVENSYERERQFTGDVSHELRTPLAIILAESQYGLQAHTVDESSRESFQVIEKQAKQMRRLVTQLLEMARIDNLAHLDVQPLSFSDIMADLVEDFSMLVEAEEKQLTFEIADGLTIKGNDPLLRRLVTNLFSNALKFSEERIIVRAYQVGDTVKCEVSNDGIGIPEQDMDKIWNRLYQVDTSRSHKGIGLGLSFVKRIASLHQATINVTSTPNALTTFTVQFKSSS